MRQAANRRSPMKIQYKTIAIELTGTVSSGTLDSQVNNALEEGWELYGNPHSVSVPVGNPKIFQALIKKSE